MCKYLLFTIFISFCFPVIAERKASITGSFNETPLKDVIEFIESLSSLKIEVPEKDELIPISVKFESTKPLEVILLICKKSGLEYRIDGEKVILRSVVDAKIKPPEDPGGFQTLKDVNVFYKESLVEPQKDSIGIRKVKRYLEEKNLKWGEPLGVKLMNVKQYYVFRTSQREMKLLGPRILIFNTDSGNVKMSVRK